MAEYTNQTIPARQARWALRAVLNAAAPEGELIVIHSGDASVFRVELTAGRLAISFHAGYAEPFGRFGDRPQFDFTLDAPFAAGELRAEWLEYSVRLYLNGQLLDEDWPLGRMPGGEWSIHCAEAVTDLEFYDPVSESGDAETQFNAPMQFFLPPGHNTGVGDCMPFARDGRYCLYYLFDRRGHRSKAGLGAHQWAQISSGDLKTWTIHPMAIGITEQWEGSICTGSLIQKDGVTYAFYAVRMSDGSPARLTWAESADGVHFEKSHKTFALAEPYEPVSARDPMVFLGTDSQYHMLVTTSLAAGGRYGGCLAHLVSRDLAEWKQLDPFIVPGYADQPECSDYFEWNGWYYLVFANFATARYRMSRAPFGPWIKPQIDILDTAEVQVAKTAAFGDRRLVSGFLSSYPRTYAGYAVTHELYQRKDGTLGTKFAEEILPVPESSQSIAPFRIVNAQGRAEAAICITQPRLRIRASLKPSGDEPLYGLTLRFDQDREYRLEFDPVAKQVSVLRPNQYFSGGDTRNRLTGIGGLYGAIGVDLIVYGDVLDVALSNGRALTMRMEAELGACELKAYVLWGALDASEIAVDSLN